MEKKQHTRAHTEGSIFQPVTFSHDRQEYEPPLHLYIWPTVN